MNFTINMKNIFRRIADRPREGRGRYTGAELMDDPGSSEEILGRTLGQFAPINRLLSRTVPLFLGRFGNELSARPDDRRVFIDVGCGGGDTLCRLARWCFRRRINAIFYGIDSDERVVRWARRACAPVPSVHILRGDAFSLDALPETPDYLIANHLLHHLSDERIPTFLSLAADRVRRGIFINDVRRCGAAYFGYLLLAALFFRKSFALIDGADSIRRGFTRAELVAVLHAAGLEFRLAVTSALPFRLVIQSR